MKTDDSQPIHRLGRFKHRVAPFSLGLQTQPKDWRIPTLESISHVRNYHPKDPAHWYPPMQDDITAALKSWMELV